MTSSPTRSMAGTVLLLVGLGVCHTTPAQLAIDRLADQQSRILDEVAAEESQNGAFCEGLIRPLTSLALLFDEHGDRRAATVTIERLMQVIRANEGLRSLDQTPWIRLLIDYAEKVHDFGTAWDFEQRLLDLAQRNPLDLRSAAIFHEIGDKRLAMLSRYVAGEFPPQIFLGCYYDPNVKLDCTSGERRRVISEIIDEATKHYSDAVNVLLANQQYWSDELRQLEVERLRNSYYQQLLGRNEYLDGADTLQRLQQDAVDGSATTQERVEVLVQMADWRLLFSRSGDDDRTALELYKHAYQDLEQAGTAQAAIDEFFSPSSPVVLPTFLPNPLVLGEPQDSDAHIDVKFEITAHGKSRRIEILDSTRKATDDQRHRLVQLIMRTQFRPRAADGKFTDATVVVRYRLNEGREVPKVCSPPSRTPMTRMWGFPPETAKPMRLCEPDADVLAMGHQR